MMILITYDVNTEDTAGKKRLRRVAKQCVNYGVRVQNSVFECKADAAEWRKLKKLIIDEIDVKKDSLRFYYFSDSQKMKPEHFGNKEAIDVEKPLIF